METKGFKLNVLLPKEQEEAIYKQVSEVVSRAISDVEQKAQLKNDTDWIKGKAGLQRYLDKLGYEGVNTVIASGLPVHEIAGLNVSFFSKKEVDKLLMDNSI